MTENEEKFIELMKSMTNDELAQCKSKLTDYLSLFEDKPPVDRDLTA